MIPVVVDYINTDVILAEQYVINDSVKIESGVRVVAPDIYIDDAVWIENHGTIIADKITVCDGCELKIINTAIIDADFVLGNGARVVQVISGTEHLAQIDFGNADFKVRVSDADGISIANLLKVAGTASEIDVYNSKLILDIEDLNNYNITFHEDVFLHVNYPENIPGDSVIDNVPSDVRVFVDTNANNPLMSMQTYVDKDKLYVKMVRETDYVKIMNNSAVGRYLNSLRGVSDADSFMSVMDNAQNMDELGKIMSDSVRMTPINLMNSVAVFNAFDLNNFNYGIGVGTEYIYSDVTDIYGAHLYGEISVGDFVMDTGLYLNRLNASDGIENYSGIMFGGWLAAKYEANVGFVRGKIGGNLTQFDISNVFDGHDGTDNPIGYSGYAVFDIGRRFDFANDVYVSPYVGGAVNYMTVLSYDCLDFVGRGGVDAGYEFEMLGIKYDYAIRLNIDSGLNVFAGAYIGFVSELDMVGGHVNFGYVNNETGQGYKISAGVDFKF